MTTHPHRLSIAPMMERTDRHFRRLMRILAPDAWVYTEMITATALVHGDSARLLEFDSSEHPVAAQLGGSDPGRLAIAARRAEEAGYDEINLNVGCPSGRVRAGDFGAALMLEPGRAAACVGAIGAAVTLPVTVKTRLGVDHHDSYEFLHRFALSVTDAGCRTLIVHARKAWLEGLSPKENREIPPLDYTRVRRLKRDFPSLEIVLNGGLTSVEAALEELEHVDGVMLGRAAYANPMVVASIARRVFGRACKSRSEALRRYAEHIEREVARGTRLKWMTRHLMGLVAGMPGARRWRNRVATLPDGESGLADLRSLIESLAEDDEALRTSKGIQREARSLYNAPQSETRTMR